jgi:uncharacterized protein (DUF3084 family)
VATPTIVVLVVVAIGTVAALVGIVLLLVERVRTVAADVEDLQRRVGPSLERLRQDVEVTSRELDRVGRSLDRAEHDEATASGGTDPARQEPPASGAGR